jgi:hypothetical protein
VQLGLVLLGFSGLLDISKTGQSINEMKAYKVLQVGPYGRFGHS